MSGGRKAARFLHDNRSSSKIMITAEGFGLYIAMLQGVMCLA